MTPVDWNDAPDPADGLTPEQRARFHRIDPLLRAAGWKIQNVATMNRHAAVGVAVREFPLGKDAVDYLLYVNGKAIGTIEAKAKGLTLSGVETQSRRYTEGFSALPDETRPKSWLWPQPLPFHYITTGDETLFESLLDPTPRTRTLFGFHRPEWLLHLVQKGSMRQGVRKLPQLAVEGLRDAQIDAITGLEESLREDRPRALVEMTMGGGKTIAAVAHAYRLLRYGQAERVLFLVDRRSLGEQAQGAFDNWVTPDDGRKFGELYPVQRLTSNKIDPAAKVVITTIQRLYAMLVGDDEYDEAREEVSGWEADDPSVQLEVTYQSKVPIETFDYIFIDECHRSIYGRWGQVLDYFDAFQTGLSATPSKDTYGYFSTNIVGGAKQPNVVSRYTHAESVLDGVNVDFKVYRIKTEITVAGAKIAKGEWVRYRDRVKRTVRSERLGEDFEYDAAKLNTAVVAENQIRTVAKAFKEGLAEMFPGRKEVPKTIVFCKDDTHAEDVVRIFRDEFGGGSMLTRKITYLTGNSQQAIKDFQTDARFRIAVSVDQISTGTDIKPIECLLFLRHVKSRLLFEQMKGRGVRTIDPADLQAVTGSAIAKTHFVLVDAVGVTDSEQAWAAAPPLDGEPAVPLDKLLATLARGAENDTLLTTIASRLSQLHGRLTEAEQAGIEQQTGGKTLQDIARNLVAATSPERQLDAARAHAEEIGATLPDPPETEEEERQLAEAIDDARDRLVGQASSVLLDPAVREAIVGIQRRSEQVIDLQSLDTVLSAGFVTGDQARKVIETWEEFIAKHRDEYVALSAYYAQPQQQRLRLKDVRALADAISIPPYGLNPDRIWQAYEALEKSRVRGTGNRKLADLVSIIRFTAEQDQELTPIADVVKLRYDLWLNEQQNNGRTFTDAQRRWLDMVAEQIATSLSMERDDFDDAPFRQHGGLIAAHRAFGSDLDALLGDLNERLVNA